MSLPLTHPVAAYFASTDEDNLIFDIFAEEAVVKDEGHAYVGPAAIKEWNLASRRKYQHTTEILDARVEGGKTLVLGRVSGNFPGSPVELTYAFTVIGGKISTLEIA